LVLLRVGFTWPAGHPTAGGLLHHLFTLTLFATGSIMAPRLGLPHGAEPAAPGAVCFCGTFPEVTFAGRYPAPCPAEPGLSSGAVQTLTARPCPRPLDLLTHTIIARPVEGVKAPHAPDSRSILRVPAHLVYFGRNIMSTLCASLNK